MSKQTGELTPVEFPETNACLSAPPGMPDCGPLHVYRDGQRCISAWTAPLRTRLAFLFGGRLWLHIVMGYTQPPVALEVSRRGPFVKPKGGAQSADAD